MSARYAQVADCTASAAKVAFSLRRASRRLRNARTGIAINAAMVIAMPAQLVAGRNREMARARSAEEPQLLSDDVSGRPDGFDFSGFGFRFHQYRSRRRCSFRQGRDSEQVLGDGGVRQVLGGSC
jgi:hypothetical protein